eukprot:852515_1
MALNKSQSEKVACKHCYDSTDKRTYINTIAFLKSYHYPSMFRSNPHPPITKQPSQWLPFIDYYPININNEPITKQKQRTLKIKHKSREEFYQILYQSIKSSEFCSSPKCIGVVPEVIITQITEYAVSTPGWFFFS